MASVRDQDQYQAWHVGSKVVNAMMPWTEMVKSADADFLVPDRASLRIVLLTGRA